MLRDNGIEIGDARFIVENYGIVAHMLDRGTQTVLHGDPHPGNTYFRSGSAGLLDWQMIRRGHAMRDIAYAMVGGLVTSDRQTHERALLDTYRKALVAAGGPELSHDDIWPRYQQSVAWAFVSALTTAGVGGLQVADIAIAGVHRAIAAMEDLNTVNVLRLHR